MERQNFMYEEDLDRLFISCKRPEDKISGSVRILNVTLDFTTDNRIVNVEIKNVSDYLRELGFDSNILSELEDASIITKQYRDGYMIYFLIKQKDKALERVPFNIVMEKRAIA
ncbi:hypothetical protein LDC_1631 [sediment metagenome]|uniref:DUF2283 domain-containing protein n=1 Tax=sediment metagenome TaxID=749907 RepID=D9PJC1_9ZZZZ